MTPISGEQLRGHLDSMVLAALESAAGHGWDICRRLEQSAGNALTMKEGSVYPALYRLERAGMIAGTWESESTPRRGPRRRVYRLTTKGRRRLSAARNEWQAFATIIGGILGAPA